jgi:hypothetical protein
MTLKFYELSYIPNKLVYVYEVYKNEILFLAFFNENGSFKAIRHSVNKKLKRDFKKTPKCFEPNKNIIKLIEQLNFKL